MDNGGMEVSARHRPMEEARDPDSSTNLRPAESPSPATMKTFLSLISVFVIAQLVGMVLYSLYLHMKLDKVSAEISLREDFVFLKRLQTCRGPQKDDTSFLDCAKISETFQDLLVAPYKVSEPNQPARQQNVQRQLASIHLAGLNSISKVLHWKNTVYAPMDDVFSHQDGKINIAKEGRYYIYAQVAFCSKPELHAPFNIYVYLNLPLESDQLLLKGVGTYSSSEDMCGLQSIHIGRVVELQSGHAVFMNVTDVSRVNYAHGNTYFGIIQLS